MIVVGRMVDTKYYYLLNEWALHWCIFLFKQVGEQGKFYYKFSIPNKWKVNLRELLHDKILNNKLGK